MRCSNFFHDVPITNHSYQRIIKFGMIILETACFGTQSWLRRTTLADPCSSYGFSFSSAESTCIANSALLYSGCLSCTSPLVLAFRREMITPRQATDGIKLCSLSQFRRLHQQFATYNMQEVQKVKFSVLQFIQFVRTKSTLQN